MTCYYGCGSMAEVSREGAVAQLECPLCGLRVMYNVVTCAWLRTQDRKG